MRLFSVFLLLFGVLLAGAPARAAWISLTGAKTAPNIAEITVFDDRVEVSLADFLWNLRTCEAQISDH